jgi:hypothetical protein
VFLALILISVVLALIAGVVWLALRSARKQQADHAARSRAFGELGARLGGHEAPSGFAVNLGDQPFTAHVTTHKGAPTGFVLMTPIDESARDPSEAVGLYRSDPRRQVAGRPRVLVRRETGRDRLGKRLRINREVQTGDAAFDAAMYLESDAPDEHVRAVLADERVRRAALELLQMGYREVVVNDGGNALTARFATNRPDLQHPDAIRRACEHMRVLSGGLPVFTMPARRSPVWWRGALTVTFAVLAPVVGLVAILWTRPKYMPLDGTATATGVLLGLGALALLLLPLAALVRGRSASFRAFLLCFGLLLFGLPMLGAGLAVGLNGALDEAPPTEHRAEVVRKRSVRGKNSTTYYLRLKSWREGETSLELPVSYALYGQVSTGNEVIVTTGPGRFGWAWRRSIARAKP